MLGEKLGEASGAMTGFRVLSPSGEAPRIEVSLQGSGELLGASITNLITYTTVLGPDGVLEAEVQAIQVFEGGETALWKGFCLGHPTGAGFAASLGFSGSFQTAPEKMASLTKEINIGEFRADEDGNYHWDLWEWAAP